MKKILWCFALCCITVHGMNEKSKKDKPLFFIFDQWALLSKELITKEMEQQISKTDKIFMGLDFISQEVSHMKSTISSWFSFSAPYSTEEPEEFNLEIFKKQKGDELFDFLSDLALPKEISYECNDEIFIEGRKAPKIMQAYFLIQDIKEEEAINRYIKDCIEKSKMLTSTQKHLFDNVTQLMFNSKKINVLINVRNDNMELLLTLKKLGHTCIFTGNMPHTAYCDVITDKSNGHISSDQRATFMKIFDIGPENMMNKKTIFISSFINKLTTNQDCFKEIIQNNNTQAKQCIYINQDPQNLKNATILGMQTIHLKDSKELKQKLIQLGVLKKISDK